MRVKGFVKMFDMLQEVEIYPVCDKKYPGQFFYKEGVDESKPFFKGDIKDIPYGLLDFIIDEEPGFPMIECRRHPEYAGATVLVLSIREPE